MSFCFSYSLQFLYVLNRHIPGVDKLKSYHAGFNVAVAKDVGAEAGSYRHVFRGLEIQRETEISDFDIASQIDAINFSLESFAVKQVDSSE